MRTIIASFIAIKDLHQKAKKRESISFAITAAIVASDVLAAYRGYDLLWLDLLTIAAVLVNLYFYDEARYAEGHLDGFQGALITIRKDNDRQEKVRIEKEEEQELTKEA